MMLIYNFNHMRNCTIVIYLIKAKYETNKFTFLGGGGGGGGGCGEGGGGDEAICIIKAKYETNKIYVIKVK